MKPGLYNTTIYQGATFDRTFTLEDTTLDLSEYDEVRMKIRRTPGSAVIWTAGEEHISIEGTDVIRLEIPADITETFRFTEAGYDIELVKTTPHRVDRFLQGKLILDKEYTR